MVVGQTDLHPAPAGRGRRRHFQFGLEGHGDQRCMLGNIALTIDVSELAHHFGHTAGSRVGSSRAELRQRDPAGVVVGGADLRPALAPFHQLHVGAIYRLREDIGIFGGLGVHVGNRFQHHGIRQCGGEKSEHGERGHPFQSSATGIGDGWERALETKKRDGGDWFPPPQG